MKDQQHIMVLGPGYTALPIMALLRDHGFLVSATYRRDETRAALQAQDIQPCLLADGVFEPPTQPITHMLVSIAPRRASAVDAAPIDPVLDMMRAHPWPDLKRPDLNWPHLNWIGYLSSTTVYGDTGGAWVDERTPPAPKLVRAQRRLLAETAWTSFAESLGAAIHIFRLAGIYGPGRSAFDNLKAGTARRIIKPGQVFGRIHVDDIAAQVTALATSGHGSDIFNLADDLPSPPQDVIAYAARLLNMAPPPEIPFEQADLSPMAASFYADCKRVRGDYIRRVTGIDLQYPDYKTGLQAILAASG